MDKRKWFIHFLKRSIGQRKGRVAVASLSIMISAAVVVAAMAMSMGIRQKLGGELKAYGANMMITPKSGHISSDLIDNLSPAIGVEDKNGQLYYPVIIRGARVEMIGVDLGRAKGMGWKITGDWPSADNEALAGASIAGALGLNPGDEARMTVGEKIEPVRITGIIETGGPEDKSIVLDLLPAQDIAGLQGKLSAVLVRAKSDRMEAVGDAIAKAVPGVRVKTLRQVALAEESFLKKIELLMALISLVVVIASSISVSSTMTATVLERMKEIGLMKAMGGTKSEIRAFYLTEAALIGVIGGTAGFIVGVASAEAASRGAFHSFIDIKPWLLFMAIGIGIIIAMAASSAPLIDALRRRPSAILRGE